jgi:hypothetical protein
MIIRYNNGYTLEAILLSRTEQSMRVATQESDDVLQLNQVNGAWVSEDCEPVQVEFAWTSQQEATPVSEEDCICSHELAANLLHMLFAGEDEPEADAVAIARVMSAPVYHQVV